VAQDRWRTIAKGQEETSAFDSHGVVQVDSGTFQAWVKTEFNQLQRFPSGIAFRSFIERTEFDCLGKRMETLEALWHDSEGDVVSSVSPSEPKWSSVVPGTRGESKWEAVCAFGTLHSGFLPRAAPSAAGGD
jgi:hypothetical protein